MDHLAQAEQLFLDALALQEKGDLERAEVLYRRALELAPDRPSVMNNLATVYLGLKKYAEARLLCERLLEMDGEDEIALLNLGNCQIRLNAAEEALVSYEKALRIKPDDAVALNNRGNALLELKRREEALATFDRALAIQPDYADALYNRGNALLELGRLEEAVTSYDRALAVKPGHAEACYNRGNALLKLRRLEDGLASYDLALALEPHHTGALVNRGHALLQLNRREELVESYQRLLRVAPDYPYMRGYLLNARLHCCEWGEYEEHAARVAEDVRAGRRADAPFNFLAISESAADQLKCARICVADEYPVAPIPVWSGEKYRHGRIRLAYLSADFHLAVAHMMTELFEAHDKARFEVTGVSFGPEPGGEIKMHLARAMERFVDVGNRSDRDVARLLREWEIDIAVDLQGFTKGCRPGIFAHRPAPVQVSYLGYPGTMGADYIDYVIGDRHVIPPEHHIHYAEKVVYLPDCYQVSYQRETPERIPARAELGLPERGFVFCCFNNNYKITPRVFDVWMRLLGKVEGSVLWLLEDNEAALRNLRREAERRGVASGRLIFAPRANLKEYLARLRLADLFLDTLPYNAHATASDALWIGLPVLTRLGGAFAGRVAASLLKAAGVPELITTTWEGYERLALKLATDSELLAGIKAKLARNRDTHPLFDTDRFRSYIEAAYISMWERVQRGEPATSFAVPGIS